MLCNRSGGRTRITAQRPRDRQTGDEERIFCGSSVPNPLDYTFYVRIASVPYNRNPLPETSAFSPARRVL
jgi:hypothetical protein